MLTAHFSAFLRLSNSAANNFTLAIVLAEHFAYFLDESTSVISRITTSSKSPITSAPGFIGVYKVHCLAHVKSRKEIRKKGITRRNNLQLARKDSHSINFEEDRTPII